MEKYQPWSHSLPMPLYEPMCALLFFYKVAVASGTPVVPTPLNLGISAYPY